LSPLNLRQRVQNRALLLQLFCDPGSDIPLLLGGSTKSMGAL